MNSEDDFLTEACAAAGAADSKAMAALLAALIDEETQTMHQTYPRGILTRLKAIVDAFLEEEA